MRFPLRFNRTRFGAQLLLTLPERLLPTTEGGFKGSPALPAGYNEESFYQRRAQSGFMWSVENIKPPQK